ncbi:MAG: c-type cytochrome [Pirellulales bacterium]
MLDELHPLTERQGDAAAGKLVFTKNCAKCHMHSGEGQKIGPDLTGMAVHPKHELLVHLIDPNRSVEGNFRVYTVVTDDGIVLTGLLAAESKTAIELIDSEAKRHVVQRENIDELMATTKSLMPEGFEKQVSPADLTNLLEFLTARGKFFALDLRKAATAMSVRGMFYSEDSTVERLVFPDWTPKTFAGVPFTLVDPQGGRTPNVVLLNSVNGKLPPTMPDAVRLAVNSPREDAALAERRERLGFQRQQEHAGDDLDDRPVALCRRIDGRSPAAERPTLRRLHPPHRRARVAICLRSQRPAGART